MSSHSLFRVVIRWKIARYDSRRTENQQQQEPHKQGHTVKGGALCITILVTFSSANAVEPRQCITKSTVQVYCNETSLSTYHNQVDLGTAKNEAGRFLFINSALRNHGATADCVIAYFQN